MIGNPLAEPHAKGRARKEGIMIPLADNSGDYMKYERGELATL
jgi:hypothetical protein